MADDAGPYEVTISLLNISFWCPTLLFEILQKKVDRVGRGVSEGQNMARNGPRLYIYIFGLGAL